MDSFNREDNRAGKNRSVRCGSKDEIDAGSAGERPEIPVACEERNRVIDAALGDKGVAETCLAALRQHLRPQLACALPIAGPELDERQFRKELRLLKEVSDRSTLR